MSLNSYFIILWTIIVSLGLPARAQSQTSFKRIATQYIAALGDPSATNGNNAQLWGLWRRDPGPRGVWLKNYEKLMAKGGIAPSQWKFDSTDWWLEENGLIMEKPEFPLAPGKYVVTGGRRVKAILTIYPKDNEGNQRWELEKGAKLYDVTHLPCRSARYTPLKNDRACLPANANKKAFKVKPGSPMPAVNGCSKQDYAVLFVIGVAVEN